MTDSPSAEVRRVVAVATEEARRLEHDRVGTEHLLLGLLSDAGPPGELLRAAGASLAAARHKVAEVGGGGGKGPASGIDDLALSPRAQRALDRGARFSRQDRAPETSAGHLLLGVLDVEGLACQVLRGLGVDVVQLRAAAVSSHSVTTASDLVDLPVDAPVAPERPRCPGCRSSLDETLAETPMTARRGADGTSIVTVVYCTACGTTMGILRPTR